MGRIKDESKRIYYIYKCTYLRKDNVEVERTFKIQSYYSVYDICYTLMCLMPKGHNELDVNIKYGSTELSFNLFEMNYGYISLYDDSNIDDINITFTTDRDEGIFKCLFNCKKIGEENTNKIITRKTPILISSNGYEVASHEELKPYYLLLHGKEYADLYWNKDSYDWWEKYYSLKNAQQEIYHWFSFYKEKFEEIEDYDYDDDDDDLFNEKIIDHEEKDEDEAKDSYLDLIEGLRNLRSYVLQKKEHIKKYHKIRKLVFEVLSSMDNEVKNNMDYYSNKMNDYLRNNMSYFTPLYNSIEFDYNLFLKLIIFLDVDDKSLVNKYLENNKFRKEEKINMLKSLSKFKVGLYRIVEVDESNAYVTLKNIKTLDRIKIVDEGLSMSYKMFKDRDFCLLGLSIEYDDITFNEISIPIINENKYVYEFIKMYKSNKLNNLEVLINGFLLDYNKKNVDDHKTHIC